MTAVLEPPPTTERQAPAEPTAPAPATNGHAAGASRSPQPPPPAQRDVPWSPSYADENPAGITTSVAITFALFGLTLLSLSARIFGRF